LVVVANGIAFLPMLLPKEQPPTSASLTLVTANVWGARNKQTERFVSFIHENHPDVICIEEVTPHWLSKLKEALPEYRYSFDEGHSGGSAIFSKIPIEKVAPPTGAHPRRYGVRGELVFGGQRMLLIAVHPPAPYTRKRWSLRNQELQRLADDVQTSQIPVVVAGDFNSTPWSGYFQRLIETAKLEDSETGHGIQSSWCTMMPLPLIPIDHCVYTKQLAVINRRTGPNVGSDHLPVIIQLGLRSQAG